MPETINPAQIARINRYVQALGGAVSGFDAEALLAMDFVSCLALLAEAAPPGLPVRCGFEHKLRDLGLLAKAVMSCGTLGQALDISYRFSRLSGEPVRFLATIDTSGSEPMWRLSFEPFPFFDGAIIRLCGDELCAALFKFVQENTSRDFHEFSAELSNPRDPDLDYARYFPGAVSFDHERSAVVGPARLLDTPITSSDPDILDMLVRQFAQADAELGLQLGPTGLLVQHYLIRARAAHASLDQAAANLGFSRRTLCRRLAAEGHSFGDILTNYRFRYCLALVREGALATKQIAHAVGFRNEHSLRKTFVRWTGMPIGKWRALNAERPRDASPIFPYVSLFASR
jgi:AraC-like DNA-binding protein